jgi:hypothetical protein
MLAIDSGYIPPSYDGFKNKKFADNKNKARAIIMSIKDSSLKISDKRELLKQIKEIIDIQI